MKRQISPVVAALVVAVLLVLIVLTWVYTQRSSRVQTEAIRQQVEQEMYREGDLGHRPGESPMRASGR